MAFLAGQILPCNIFKRSRSFSAVSFCYWFQTFSWFFSCLRYLSSFFSLFAFCLFSVGGSVGMMGRKHFASADEQRRGFWLLFFRASAFLFYRTPSKCPVSPPFRSWFSLNSSDDKWRNPLQFHLLQTDSSSRGISPVMKTNACLIGWEFQKADSKFEVRSEWGNQECINDRMRKVWQKSYNTK